MKHIQIINVFKFTDIRHGYNPREMTSEQIFSFHQVSITHCGHNTISKLHKTDDHLSVVMKGRL